MGAESENKVVHAEGFQNAFCRLCPWTTIFVLQEMLRPRKTLPPTAEKRHHQMVAVPFLERVGNLLFTEQLTILRLSSLRFDTTVKSPSKIS